MIDLYKNIKKERIAHGMSQEELAHKVGYADKGMISRIENGKVDLPQSKIIEFADVLGVTPGYLMGWTENHETGHLMFDWNEFLRENPNEAVDAYVFNDNNGVIELKEDEVNVAVKLYELYKKADPTVKSAIDTLLKKN